MSALPVMSVLAVAGWSVAWLMWQREKIARDALARRESHYRMLCDTYAEHSRALDAGGSR